MAEGRTQTPPPARCRRCGTVLSRTHELLGKRTCLVLPACFGRVNLRVLTPIYKGWCM